MPFATLVKNLKKQQRELRVLIIGLDSSGKTTCVRNLLGLETDSVQPTLGFQIQQFTTENSQIALWDVGGQRTIRAFWKSFCDSTDGLFWVLDSADSERLYTAIDALNEVLGAERLKGCPVIVFGNKQDIEGAKTQDQLEKLFVFENRDVRIFTGSGRNGVGITEAFDWLVEKMESSGETGGFIDLEAIY
ncbi:ADP-ribosylation factor like protein 2b [Spironucleus salmonicida]|uniref:ADP-ribosylation factor n=1 Tax=Spironucleus salmonicida TaxID=348837 RepID=V6LGJ6_9EUKA|nr:ADP-ribosylation factor like protein 2b [Spironucleus salmonicida]|eukprot:EST42811.1 ADP-ribosylation factor [Spironucleus salmonicida]